MKPFMTPKEAERKQKQREQRNNPTPGRDPKTYMRITRSLDQINKRLDSFLSATDNKVLKWLPHESVVTEKDDEWQYDLYAQINTEDTKVDHDGYLNYWEDKGIKATNRIVVITWYKDNDENGDAFIIKKPILSPLPCPTWGRLPITLAQWRRISLNLIHSEIYWRWTNAVRDYVQNQNMNIKGIVGWHLEPTQKVSSMDRLARDGKGYIIDMRPQADKEECEQWVGANICRDITAEFLQND